MNKPDFLKLLDIYGADIARWPAEVQEEAEVFLANSRDAHQVAHQIAEVDRLLMACAPVVGPERVDHAVLAVLRSAEVQPQPKLPARLAVWLMGRLAPASAIYCGLFVLGCLANLLMRLMLAQAPLNLLFSGLLRPLGE
jgi:hypothetical protein